MKDLIIKEQKEYIKKLEEKFQEMAGIVADGLSHQEDLSEKYAAALKAKDGLISAQKARIKNFEESGLVTDGIYCRAELAEKYITLKAGLGDISNGPEVWEIVREILEKFPIDYFWSEVRILERRQRERLIKRRIETSKHAAWSRILDNFF